MGELINVTSISKVVPALIIKAYYDIAIFSRRLYNNEYNIIKHNVIIKKRKKKN